MYIVNANGDRVTDAKVGEALEQGRRLYDIRIPSDHFAILVRKIKQQTGIRFHDNAHP